MLATKRIVLKDKIMIVFAPENTCQYVDATTKPTAMPAKQNAMEYIHINKELANNTA